MSNAPDASVFKVRRSRRAAIAAFFLDHLGERFGTMTLQSELRAPIQEPSESPYMRRRREEDAAAMPLFAAVRP